MIYTFGEYEWDEGVFELRCKGEPIPATPRVLETIAYLIQHRARAISKQELLDKVWKGTSVSDGALSQTILLARKALGDEGERQQIIKTVRGLGFRFIAPVSEREARERPTERAPAPLADREPDTRLIGRASELALLEEQLAGAAQGRGSMALIEGEPGIGKTSLVKAFAKAAARSGAQVLWGRVWEEGGAPAFWPWTQVLRAVTRQLEPRAQAGSADDALLPLLSDTSAASAVSAPASLLDAAQQRFRVFAAAADLLRQATAASGSVLVVILEDLHAADEPSVQLLRFLAPELDVMPIVLIGTLRDLEVRAGTALSALREGPLEHSSRLVLRGLELADVARMLERLSGEPVPEALVLRIRELSHGNPLLVGELGRQVNTRLAAPGELSVSTHLRLPERVIESVQRRVRQLPVATQHRLSLASVLGREFSIALLSRLAGCSERELLEDIGPAFEQGLLNTGASSTGARLSFAHALVRDALYAGLPPGARIDLHYKTATALEQADGTRRAPLFELAHHYFLAAPGGAAGKALEYALKAAQAANDMAAHATAGTLYDRAVELCDLNGTAESTVHELLLSAGHAWYASGRLSAAIERYERASQLARAQGDAERFCWAVVWYFRASSETILYDARLIELAAEAIKLLPPGDSAVKAMLLTAVPFRYGSFGPVSERLRIVDEALQMARRVGDPFALCAVLSSGPFLLTGVTAPENLVPLTNELIAVAAACGNDHSLLLGLLMRMSQHTTLADFAAAQRDFAEYAAYAEARKQYRHIYWCAVMRATHALRAGKLGEAEQLVKSAYQLGQRIQYPAAALIHAMQQFQLHYDRGLPHEVPAEALAAVPRDESASLRVAWMFHAFRTGQHADAFHTFSDLATDDFAQLPYDFSRLVSLAALTFYAYMIEDGARCKVLRALLEPYRELAVITPATNHYLGPVSAFMALCSACCEEHERAEREFAHALVQCTRAGARIRVAEFQCEYGLLLWKAKIAPARGAELVRQALAAADELGLEHVRLRAGMLESVMKT